MTFPLLALALVPLPAGTWGKESSGKALGLPTEEDGVAGGGGGKGRGLTRFLCLQSFLARAG